ncbi:MAG: hypothetical protein ABS95_00220 [Verrucomicrobia bacterium SCN 57-15]|nr:MAG: hypothetical protein ABS95_00220 [Verrucomicrobia bacterium SCN 57-15]
MKQKTASRKAWLRMMKMNNKLQDPGFRDSWTAIAEPGWEINQEVFSRTDRNRTKVLHCAIPLTQASRLTNVSYPPGWDANKCLAASVGRKARPELANWDYAPQIRAEAQLPNFKDLPAEHKTLVRSPWFQSPSQASSVAINARHLRYHHDLWNELQPKTLRGVHATMVYVTPQLGFSLTPHIKMDKAFHYFAALSRWAGPAQLFPAAYLYPDSKLGQMQRTPAPIFADLLPCVGGSSFPVMDCTPDPWGKLARFEGPDYYYGYPFHAVSNSAEDVTLQERILGSTILPNGQLTRAIHSESYVYATLDAELNRALKLDREAFMENYCLARGVVTHDGLPFQLPVEMQTAVFAIVLTAWELEMKRPGDLTSFSLKTQHAAIRGYHFYQKIEPYYSNFMRLVKELAKDPNFEVYPLATHLTHSWLGGNLCVSNQQSESEKTLGAQFMRSYYRQQLDWMMGVFNLWNTVEFRKGADLENKLDFTGLAMHQMQPHLAFESHYFQRPLKRASFWPDQHPEWLRLDQEWRADQLPQPEER